MYNNNNMYNVHRFLTTNYDGYEAKAMAHILLNLCPSSVCFLSLVLHFEASSTVCDTHERAKTICIIHKTKNHHDSRTQRLKKSIK